MCIRDSPKQNQLRAVSRDWNQAIGEDPKLFNRSMNTLLTIMNGPANHPDVKKIFSHFDGKCHIPHSVTTN